MLPALHQTVLAMLAVLKTLQAAAVLCSTDHQLQTNLGQHVSVVVTYILMFSVLAQAGGVGCS
jgi:hypothetical protein